MSQRKGITSTDAVHAGEEKRKAYDALPMPIVQTATYAFADTAEIVAYTEGRHPNAERGEYGRYGNPTVRAVEKRLAALEGTEDAASLRERYGCGHDDRTRDGARRGSTSFSSATATE